MKLAVFSDIHDNLHNLDLAIGVFHSRGISIGIFCGDFCSPIPSKRMSRFNGTIHCVFGNGDGDRAGIMRIASSESKNLILHGEHAELTVETKRIAVTHYPLYGRALAHTRNYDAVFSGHTHEMSKEYISDCLWLNPGEVMGWKGTPTVAIYDTATNQAEIVGL
jgi:uncharacterized protein